MRSEKRTIRTQRRLIKKPVRPAKITEQSWYKSAALSIGVTSHKTSLVTEAQDTEGRSP